ncbi:MAG TPA: hypothetical protein DCS21_05770 [Gammaproteobacteria bacterium]|nr:hypothetical protein [Gammaproteobacteria bacterium]
MNIQGSGVSFDFRKIEPKRLAAKPEPTIPPKAEPEMSLSLMSRSTGKLPAVLVGLKSDLSASRETGLSEETTETLTEETTLDGAEGSDESGDLSSDYEPMNERDEDPEEPDDQTEEQRQPNGHRLDALETQYRSQFLILDQLIEQLTATDHLLTQQI